jgi:hypothetical protein
MIPIEGRKVATIIIQNGNEGKLGTIRYKCGRLFLYCEHSSNLHFSDLPEIPLNLWFKGNNLNF